MGPSELDALIARNIEYLEAAFNRAKDTIDPIVNREAWTALKAALKDCDYHFDDDDDLDKAWFVPRSWLDEDDDSDPWFRLTARDTSGLRTWLARFVAPRSDREAIGIQWYAASLYVRDYKVILDAHARELREIEEAGFRRDGKDIYLPISFDAVRIVEGFKEGDLAEALAPITKAAHALEKARPLFQCLRDAIVAKAAG